MTKYKFRQPIIYYLLYHKILIMFKQLILYLKLIIKYNRRMRRLANTGTGW